MNEWEDNGRWSKWVCAHEDCNSECEDPDLVSVTTCRAGHVNYLGPASESNQRRAFRTAKERSKALREEQTLCQVFAGFQKTVLTAKTKRNKVRPVKPNT